MSNALSQWWKHGSLGTAKVAVDDGTIVKIVVAVIVAFVIIYLTYSIIRKAA